MSILATILAIVGSALGTGLVIWIVGKLGVGLEVKGFGSAFIAAIVIAVVAGLVNWLLGALGVKIGGGILGGVISLILSAIVLIISDRILPGIKVNGFSGAVITVIAIGVVTWLIHLLLGAIGV
jgi:putative membrane protein